MQDNHYKVCNPQDLLTTAVQHSALISVQKEQFHHFFLPGQTFAANGFLPRPFPWRNTLLKKSLT